MTRALTPPDRRVVGSMLSIRHVMEDVYTRLRPATIGSLTLDGLPVHWECEDCALGCRCTMPLRHARCYGTGHD